MHTPLPWRLRAYTLPATRYLLLLAVWLLAASGALAQTSTIGSTTLPVASPATSSYLYGPIYRSSATSVFDYSRYAHLYTPAELGIPAGAVITQLAWLKSDAGELTGNNVFNVLLNNTATPSLVNNTTWATVSAGATSVYTSTTQQITGAAGTYFSVTLSQPFVYTGGNLLVLLDHQKLGTASGIINFVTNPATGFAIGYADSSPITTVGLTTGSYGDRRPTLRITYAPATACTAPPVAGTTLASSNSICTGNSVSLSLQGATFGTGLTYQWQESTNGTTYTDIAGATSFNYTTPVLTATRFYRARLTCSGQSATSTPAQITVLQTTYASLPVIESFENTWQDVCNSHDAPTTNWRTNPSTGNSSWRRDDDGVTASWTSPTVGVYTPAASQGSRSARFHSYYAGAAATGSLDLYVNLSAAGSKRLVFDYINTAGNDSLLVSVSTNGGATFGAPVLRLGMSGTIAQGFRPQTVTLTSTSATTVVRFTGKVTTTFTSDIGVDDVRIEALSGCLSPTALTVTGTTATSAVVSWASAGNGTYTVFYGVAGFTPGGTGSQQITGITGTTTTITGLTASTDYQFYVRQNCGGTSSGNAGPVPFRTDCLTPLYATLPVVESFENTWISRCNTRDVPSNNWRNTPLTGNNSWRREDDGVAANWGSATSGTYTPSGSQGAHSARFHSYLAPANAVGTLDLYVNLSSAGSKRLSFDYINTSGVSATRADTLTVQLSTDGGATFGAALLRLLPTSTSGWSNQTILLSSTSATAVVRFRVNSDFSLTDVGLDNIRLESAAGCLAPINLTTTGTTANSAVVTWQGTSTGTYTVFYGTTGFTPGGMGSQQITGITGTTATITGLAASTQYEFYVRQDCGGTSSANAGPSVFRTDCVTPLYASVPFLETFENTWLSRCNTREVPGNSWRNTPLTGDNSWRREDDGVAANWTSPTSWSYSPSGSQSSSHSARFHSGEGARGEVGTLDLFVNLSAPGNKELSFDYINTTGAFGGPDSLTVQVSTNGGATFGPRLLRLAIAPSFQTQTLQLTSTSATTVIRFRAVADFGTTDLGIDNVTVSSCARVSGVAVSNITGTSATVTFTPVAGVTSYTVVATSATGAPVTVTASGSPAQLTGLQGLTQYTVGVVSNCAPGQTSVPVTATFTTLVPPSANDEPCNATLLTAGAPALNATNLGATTTAPNGYQNPGCTTASAPKDVWFRFTATATTAQVAVTGNPAGQVRLFSASACTGPFTPLACQASMGANMSAGSLNAAGLVVGNTYYASVSGFGSSDFPGPFTIRLSTVLSTGTGQLPQGEVSLYPNPSHDGTLNLAIRGAGAVSSVQAVLVNSLGQQVLTQTVAVRAGQADKALPVQRLAKGLYTLRLQVGQTVITRKVVLD